MRSGNQKERNRITSHVSSERLHSIRSLTVDDRPCTQHSRKHCIAYGNLSCTSEQLCVQLSTSVHGNGTLLAFAAERRPCSNRSIFPGCRAHSSKLAAVTCGSQMMGQKGHWTDRRTERRADGRSSTVLQTPNRQQCR